jgi:hypothetical protein
MSEETTTVEVKHDTYRALDIRKEVGESFDDAIRRLIGQVGPGVGEIETDPAIEAGETIEVDDPPAGASCSHYDMIANETCGEPAAYLHTVYYDDDDGTEMYLCEDHASTEPETTP